MDRYVTVRPLWLTVSSPLAIAASIASRADWEKALVLSPRGLRFQQRVRRAGLAATLPGSLSHFPET